MSDRPRTTLDAIEDLTDAVRELVAVALEGWKYAGPLVERLTAITERLEREGGDDGQHHDNPGNGSGTGED